MAHPHRLLLPLSLMLIIVCYLSINIALPLFPTLEVIFAVPYSQLQYIMTAFLFVYALSQISWGFIADSIGRRRTLLISLAVTIVGTLLTCITNYFHLFFAGRLIEAAGVGAGTVLARTLLADGATERTLNIEMVYIISLASLLPGLAPFIGSYIFIWTAHWQAVFWFLLVITLVTYIFTYFTYHDPSSLQLKPFKLFELPTLYFILFKNKVFVAGFIIYGLMLGLLISFYTLTPHIYLTFLKLPPSYYSMLVFFISASYFIGAVLTRFLIDFLSTLNVLLLGITLTLVSALLFTLEIFFVNFTAFSTEIPMTFFALGCGFISPSCNTLAISVAKEKGTASAAMACIAMIAASIFSAIFIKLPLNALSSYASIFMSVNIIAWALMFLYLKPAQQC